ncbi:hypothetical protein AB0J38_42880 [Streptomyces sp. NPDC050095]|uniref:hypothetical protein n=1 Tax=unclassified Streptomyces TaxID=2593676 RepID=UPI003416AE49
MAPTPLSRRARFAVTLVALPALLGALTSCSSGEQKREYTTPESLCGTRVDSDALSTFLPPGRQVAVEQTVSTSRARRCAVSVDGRRIVYAAQEWWNDMSVLNFAQGLTDKQPEHRTDDGRYAYSETEAFGRTEDCHSGEHADQRLYTAVQATGSRHKDADAMKRLISTYTKQVEESEQCRG